VGSFDVFFVCLTFNNIDYRTHEGFSPTLIGSIFSVISAENLDTVTVCFATTSNLRCTTVTDLEFYYNPVLPLQSLGRHIVAGVMHHERDVRREQAVMVITTCDLHCCLLQQCKALRACHSGPPIATLLTKHFISAFLIL